MSPKEYDLLVFVHVEKAGGISIHNMLHHELLGYISPAPDYGEQLGLADFKRIQRNYPLRISGVGGHRISPTAVYSSRQYRFSLLREPLKRFVSHLNWQIHQMHIAHDLQSFCQNEYFNNFQTFRLTRAKSFKEAKAVIKKHYNFIGLLEAFDQSIGLLSTDYFGDANHLLYEVKNQTKATHAQYLLEELTAKQQQWIKSANQLDLDVYAYVKEEIFLPRVATLGEYDLSKDRLVTPFYSRAKRKLSNYYLRKMIQPRFQQAVDYGY